MENSTYYNSPSQSNDLYPDVFPVFLLIFVTLLLVIAVGGFLAVFVGKAAVLLSEVIIILPALLFVIIARAPIVKTFRIKISTPRIMGHSFLVAIGVFVLADQLDRLIQAILPVPDLVIEAMEETLTITSLADGFVIIFSAVILAGLCEEMLFRGIFQGTLESHWKARDAVVISAIVFSAIHLSIWMVLQIIALGLVLGYMAHKSGSILPGVIVHASNNFFSIIMINLGAEKIKWYTSGLIVNPIVLLGALIMVFLGLKVFKEIKNPILTIY
jgi:membrane protease YdiL (CAAX protease family)